MSLISDKLKSLGKTQKEIAEEVGVSQVYVSGVMNGKVLKTDAIKKFTDLYGWNLYEIIQDFEKNSKVNNFLSHLPEPEPKLNPTLKDINKAIRIAKEKKEQKENAKPDDDLPILKEVKVIPEKVALGLVSSFFDNEYVNALETELVPVEEYFSEDAYKVDTVGESMNDGTLRSLLDGDKYLAKDIPRSKWGEKLINGGKNLFYILHAERGHLIKEIIEHNIEDKIITLHSYNPSKKLFPDFTIKTTECYIIASIQELLSRKI